MQFQWRAELDDPPRLHHRDPVGDIKRLGRVMRHQHHGRTRLAQQDAAFAAEAPAQHDVDAGEGLVHQQHLRFGRHRPGERGALLLAARKLVREARAHPRQPDLGEPCVGLPAPLARQAEGDIGGQRHVREQRAVLKHEADRARFGRGIVHGVGQHLIAQRDLALLDAQQARREPQKR